VELDGIKEPALTHIQDEREKSKQALEYKPVE
jgi:hypothetical protein